MNSKSHLSSSFIALEPPKIEPSQMSINERNWQNFPLPINLTWRVANFMGWAGFNVIFSPTNMKNTPKKTVLLSLIWGKLHTKILVQVDVSSGILQFSLNIGGGIGAIRFLFNVLLLRPKLCCFYLFKSLMSIICLIEII